METVTQKSNNLRNALTEIESYYSEIDSLITLMTSQLAEHLARHCNINSTKVSPLKPSWKDTPSGCITNLFTQAFEVKRDRRKTTADFSVGFQISTFSEKGDVFDGIPTISLCAWNFQSDPYEDEGIWLEYPADVNTQNYQLLLNNRVLAFSTNTDTGDIETINECYMVLPLLELDSAGKLEKLIYRPLSFLADIALGEQQINEEANKTIPDQAMTITSHERGGRPILQCRINNS